MKRVKFREEAERLNVSIEAIVDATEKLLYEGKVYVIIDKKNEEFIYYSPEEIENLTKLLESKRVLIEELAEKLSLKIDQVCLIIDKLLNENRVKGLLTEDAFVPDSVITKEREEYKKTVERLTTLFSKGEISEEAYKTAIKSLENGLRETISIRYEEVEILRERRVLPVTKEEKHVEKRLTTSQITALVILAVILMGFIFGGIWWYSLPKTATFTVNIESDTSWSGAIGTIEEGQRTVEGSGSQSYTLHGTIASAVVQKMTSRGYLRVSLYKNGNLVASQETTANYGGVSVSSG